MLALDVPTKGHLNTCLAIRVTAFIHLMSDSHYKPKAIRDAVEACPYAKLSKQKFLDPRSHDTKLAKGRKGLGGNTVVQNCCIISQAEINTQVLEKIRQGTHKIGLAVHDRYITCQMYRYSFFKCSLTV